MPAYAQTHTHTKYTLNKRARYLLFIFMTFLFFFGMFIYKIYSGLFSVTTHTHTIDEKNNHEFKNAMVFVCILCSDNEWICKFIRFILYRLQAPFGCYVIWSSKHQQHHLIGNVYCGIHAHNIFQWLVCERSLTITINVEQHERIVRFLWLLFLLLGLFRAFGNSIQCQTTDKLWNFHTFYAISTESLWMIRIRQINKC